MRLHPLCLKHIKKYGNQVRYSKNVIASNLEMSIPSVRQLLLKWQCPSVLVPLLDTQFKEFFGLHSFNKPPPPLNKLTDLPFSSGDFSSSFPSSRFLSTKHWMAYRTTRITVSTFAEKRSTNSSSDRWFPFERQSFT